MSSVTEQSNLGNFAHFQYNFDKIFIRNNRFRKETFLNNTGAALDVAVGTVLGMIAASERVRVLASAGADGSQFPYGVIAEPISQLANNGTQEVNVCIGGDIAEEQITLGGSDALDTVVANKTIRARIHSDTLGIILVPSDQLSGFDNQ